MLQNAFIEISDYIRKTDFNYNEEDLININGKMINKHKIVCDDIFFKYANELNINIIGFVSDTSEFMFLKNRELINNDEKQYIIAYKSLDGLTNMYSNITCGSIYGIYEYINNEISNIVYSGYCIYGNKTVLVQVENKTVKMYKLNEYNLFKYCKDVVFNSNNNPIYSINELNKSDPEIIHLIRHYNMKKYDQRWTGTMTADCHRILMNNGIFIYFSTDKYKHGKLSLLYQVLPFAYIFKYAGGIGLNGNYNNILEYGNNIKINDIHRTSSVILCSNTEYDKFNETIRNYEIYKF